MEFPHIYLASKSPRRQQILKMIGMRFTVIETNTNEDEHFAQTPSDYVLSLSQKKANDAALKISNGIVLAADTIVYIDGQILNKPKDADDARRMLKLLSEKTHQVYTGFTLLRIHDKKTLSDFGVTDVTFRRLDEDELEEYIKSGAPFDKAGAYGIQEDMSALFVEKINGDFYNVVGLPLPKFYLALKKFLAQ
jgi:septum formation protein